MVANMKNKYEKRAYTKMITVKRDEIKSDFLNFTFQMFCISLLPQ